MLDDDTGGLGEVFDTLQGRVGVRHVIVGKLLALQLPGGGDARLCRLSLTVEGGSLVRIFAVAHFLQPVELSRESPREGLTATIHQAAKVIRDSAVVGRRVLEGLDGKVEAGSV